MTMKKTLVTLSAAVALLGCASCSNCDKGSCNAASGSNCDVDKVYTGVLPGADVEGIRYTVALDYDDNGNEGDYFLVQTYFNTDSVATGGVKDVNSFKSEGDFTVVKKDGKTFLMLVPEGKKSSAADNLYFEVDNDATITMVNADYERAEGPLNYTLNLVK